MNPWKRLVLPALGILLAILVWINWDDLACKFLGNCPQPRPGMNLVKCPGHPFALELAPAEHEPGGTRVLSSQGLAGPRAAITEVQDCQRLVERDPDDNLRFGPLAALFASDQLATQFDAPPGATGTFGDQRAAAQVYSNGPYSPLGIGKGSSCLYISKIIRPATGTTPATVAYTARMEPAFTDDACLSNPAGAEGRNLEVRVVSPPGVTDEDLPVAARWAGGGRMGDHYISLRCGNAWCEVGDPGFVSEHTVLPELNWSEAGYPDSDLRDQAAARIRAIPGWFDQQHLAVRRVDPNTGKRTLVPSPVRATLVPHPLLATLNADTDFEHDWVEVANVWLPEAVEGYAEKMNFKPRWNRIAYRRGTRTEALGGESLRRPCPEDAARPTGIGDWWARITASDGTHAYFCVTKYAHAGLNLPGVVRWRWMEEDETTWIRCPGGCCPVE